MMWERAQARFLLRWRCSAWKGHVYGHREKGGALALLKENKQKFATDNLEIVPGTAPEAMVELPCSDTCLYRWVFRKYE